MMTDGFLAFESGGKSFRRIRHDLHSIVVPHVQEPFNAHRFKRIKIFLDDSLRVGVNGFDCELAHNKHNLNSVRGLSS
jgi:hypothetical protein